MTPIDAALDYARRGWPLFPVRENRVPFTEHGQHDASLDASAIGDWWRRWPDAVPVILTGERSGVVALDIDIRPDGSGFDTLAELGMPFHLEGPTAHSPRGGAAVLFAWPGHPVRSSNGRIGQHLDIKGDGGSITLPPGRGRRWDPLLGVDTPLARMPDWLDPAEPEPVLPRAKPTRPQRLTRYAEKALDSAFDAIADAPDGQQRDTLNREAFGVGQLVGGGVIPGPLALESLRCAATKMRSFDPRRPWRERDLDRMVRDAFTDGMAQPRQPESHRG